MVVSQVGMKGVAGGELRGSRWLREFWALELRWLPVVFEQLGGSARRRGVGWWCWLDSGGPGCDETDRRAAVAELAGDGEDGLSWSIAS